MSESMDTLLESGSSFSEKSLPLSVEPENLLTKNNDSSFSDFSAIKSLLNNMVNIVDVNESKENNILHSTNANTNVVEEPYYRHFDVFVIDAQKTWPDRISTIGMKMINFLVFSIS